jgi:hypothetical protein
MSSTPVTLRLAEPAETISIVPYLLGFHPTTSVGVLALREAHVLAAARLDLPTDFADRARYIEAALELTDRLAASGAEAAILIGYGPVEPVALAVDLMTAILAEAGIAVRDALRVGDQRWWHLSCIDPMCCPAYGTAFDPSTSVAAASATVAGLVALPSRDAVAAQLAPICGPARQAFAAATEAAVTRLLDVADLAAPEPGNGAGDSDAWMSTPAGEAMTIVGQQLLTEALGTYRHGQVLDDHRAATLTVLLGMPAVRDAAIRLSTGDDWQIRMWTDLVRRVEPEFTPVPAVLLALAALQAGNGILADCAVRRALDADPDNRVAQLVLQLVQTGIDPYSTAALIAAI